MVKEAGAALGSFPTPPPPVPGRRRSSSVGAGQSLSLPQQADKGSEVVSPFKTPKGTEFTCSGSPIRERQGGDGFSLRQLPAGGLRTANRLLLFLYSVFHLRPAKLVNCHPSTWR